MVDFYQREIVKLNECLDHVKEYLDGTEVLGRAAFDNHVEELDEVLTQVEESGLQVNIAKRKYSAKEAKYLGHIVATDGHILDPRNAQVLVTIKEPNTKR